ncbi:MAG: Rrf2 family transcriptional regulator [Hyphomonas sp. BRH_c22]|uniref:RrF2 family transcriptional regulator n=1 Tax=Hyphomonas sp. BRH_c22 TaxID=1629710 RepID=UPI0005F0F017|nr:Rrf2 family transcriptional regulator [Hyphomonas sp. BRH_c22]KJS37212.1 MAG: Rrf2 family transcriptional regulator [Hyphomonas sp. BRH_c22]
MKINRGVEWAAHACTLLAALPQDWTLSAEALADYHNVPPAYMAKQMQALSQAGIVVSRRGAVGGYSLAKSPKEISLWNIMAAVEGSGPAFRCTEIRQNGPCGAKAKDCKKPCGIAASFFKAEQAFKDVLSQVTLLDMIHDAAASSTPEKAVKIADWIKENSANQRTQK